MEEVINVMVLEDYKKLKWGKEMIVVPLAFMNSTSDLMENPVPLLARSGDLWFWVKDKKLMAYKFTILKVRRLITRLLLLRGLKCQIVLSTLSLAV